MTRKLMSYEMNCKIQFTKIICTQIRLIFISESLEWNQAKLLIPCLKHKAYNLNEIEIL